MRTGDGAEGGRDGNQGGGEASEGRVRRGR